MSDEIVIETWDIGLPMAREKLKRLIGE